MSRSYEGLSHASSAAENLSSTMKSTCNRPRSITSRTNARASAARATGSAYSSSSCRGGIARFSIRCEGPTVSPGVKYTRDTARLIVGITGGHAAPAESRLASTWRFSTRSSNARARSLNVRGAVVGR